MFECQHIRTVANVQEYEYRHWRFRVEKGQLLWKMKDCAKEKITDDIFYSCSESLKLPRLLKKLMKRIDSEIQESLIHDALDNNHMDIRDAHTKGLHA